MNKSENKFSINSVKVSGLTPTKLDIAIFLNSTNFSTKTEEIVFKIRIGLKQQEES